MGHEHDCGIGDPLGCTLSMRRDFGWADLHLQVDQSVERRYGVASFGQNRTDLSRI